MMQTQPRCTCGHDRAHHFVVRKNRYTKWGWFLFFTGISAVPYRVDFQCSICNEVFDSSTEPEELKKYLS